MTRKLIGSVFLILLFAIIAVGLVVSTETGLTLLWRQANKFLPEELSIEAIQGKLTGPIIVNGFNYQSETLNIDFDQAQLHWVPSGLLSLTFHITLAEINNLHVIQVGKNPDKNESVTLPDKIELPLKIIVERFRIDQVEFKSSIDAEPFHLDYAEVIGVFDEDSFTISKLDIDGPKINVTGNIQTIPYSEYTSQGELHWGFAIKDLPILNGITIFEGNLQQIEVKQILQQPYNVDANISLNDLLDSFGFSANINFAQVNLQEIKKDLPVATVTGMVDAEGTLSSVNIQAKLQSNQTEYGTLNAELAGNISKQVIDITKLELNLEEKPTKLIAHGKINLSEKGSELDISAAWEDFNWPLLEEPQLQSKLGKLTVMGTLDSYQLQSSAELRIQKRLDADISLIGIGDKRSLTITQVDVNTLDGNIKGSSLIQWQPKLEAKVDLIGKNINPKQLADDWPGKLDFQLKAYTNKGKEDLSVVFEQLHIDGKLRNYKLKLFANGDYLKDTLNLEKFELTSGETHLIANGALGEVVDLYWQVDSDNINSLLPNASGKINSEGIVKGLIKQPLIKGELSGHTLKYQDYKIESVNLDLDIDLANKNNSTLIINLDDININDTIIKTTKLKLDGTLDNHTLDFNLSSNQGDAQLTLQAGLSEFPSAKPIWNFQLKQGEISYPKLAAWVLQSPSNGRISKSYVELTETCWASDQAHLCFDSLYEQDNVNAKFILKSLPFNYFSELLPQDMMITGEINGKGNYSTNKKNASTIDLQFNTTAIEVSLPNNSGEQTVVLTFKSGNASVLQNEAGLQANFALPLQKNGGIDLVVNVASGNEPFVKRSLNGDINIQLDDLSTYEELIPQIEQLKGKIDGDIVLSGNIQSPVFKGQIMLQEGAADLPDFGLALNKINLALSGADANNLNIKGNLSSGGGELNVNGTLGYTEKSATTNLTLKGEKFEIYNTLDAHLYASPNLELAIEGKRVNISGEVSIPQADITPNKNTSSGAITVSKDQVIVVPKSEQQETPYLITTQVKVLIGPDVHFSAYGLNTDLNGSIAINDKPKKSTKGKGEINLVGGEFHAYGQELNIDTGKIIFTGGPIDQPGIDLRASRNPRKDILVGVEVRGNINNPNIKLFSDPSMSRSEQLSYLTLGKPLQDASAGESSAINQAALSIGFAKSSKITDEIGKKLGIDEAGFESTKGKNGGQSTFALGKYLSPKLYISYGIGVFEPVNIFRLQYFLSKHWKLVTESSGGNSGGDIYYEIERGK